MGLSPNALSFTKITKFEAKNQKSDDVYMEYKRRSFYDFAAEFWNLQ